MTIGGHLAPAKAGAQSRRARRSRRWVPAFAGTPGRATNARPGGFTLVEVLVALLVFGILAAAGVALLSFGVRAQAATTARAADDAALVRLGAALTADLAQAVDRPARDGAGNRLPAFTGGTGGDPLLRLTRAGWDNPDGQPRASLQRVEWRVADGALSRTGYAAVDGAAALPAAAILPGVADVRLRFRFAGAWSDRWDGSVAPLPQAVELTWRDPARRAYRQLFVVGSQFAPRPRATPPENPDA